MPMGGRNANQRLQQAIADHRAGRLSQAESAYRELLAARPDHPDILHLLGLARLGRGHAGEAAQLIQRAVAAAPDRPGYHNDLGEALRAAGDRDGARAAYGRAVALAPDFFLGHFNLGNLLAEGGDAAAIACFEQALAIQPQHAPSYANLGTLLQRLGRFDAALAIYDRAQAAGLVDPEILHERATVLQKLGRGVEAEACIRQALALDAGFAPAYANLAETQRRQGKIPAALISLDRALELQPEHMDWRRERRELIGQLVPQWHFPMMNDERRNAAYAQALARHVRPDMHVLEIGTGGGLLAMLAVRAGARHVTTCEQVGVVADTARRIIAANGMGERITVIGKPSTELKVGVDLPQRADLLISEILSSEFVGEGVLSALNHAMSDLVQPGARSIPLGGAALGCLVGGAELERHFRAGPVDGLDMSLFNALLAPVLTVRLNDFAFDCLSEVVELDSYRLPQAALSSEPRRIEFPVVQPGRSIGVAQWIRIDLDETLRFSNDPREDIGRASSGWQHMLYMTVEPIAVAPGQRLRYRLQQTTERLLLEPAGAG